MTNEPSSLIDADNSTLRVLFSQHAVTCKTLRLHEAWQALKQHGDYPPGLEIIMGEALAGLLLMIDDLPQAGKYRLQLNNQKFSKLIMLETNQNGAIRGIARWPEEQDWQCDFGQLFDGCVLSFMVLPDTQHAQWQQSIVEIQGDSMAQCLEAYFGVSTQLQSSLYLAANGDFAAGLLLQKMPDDQSDDAQADYAELKHFTDTIKTSELLDLSGDELTHRLFNEFPMRVFKSDTALHFKCTCSQSKVEGMLQNMGQEAALEALEDTPSNTVEVHCEFCNALYAFDTQAIKNLFDQKTH